MRLSNNAVFNAASPAPRFYGEPKWWRCNWRTTAEIYTQLHELTATSTAIHPPKVWERYIDDACSILKRTHLENYSHYISNLHQNIKFTIKEESNGKLAFLDTFWNTIMGRFLYWYIGTLHTLTDTYTVAPTTKQVARKVLLSLYLTEHIPLSQIKMV